MMLDIDGAFKERRGSLKRRLFNQPMQRWSQVGGREPDYLSGNTQYESGKATGDMEATQDDIAGLSRNYWVNCTRTPAMVWHTKHLQN